MVLSWDEAVSITRFSCHAKCQGAFTALFERLLGHFGAAEINKLRINRFGGCLNVRPKRGTTDQWSTHAFGAAVDLDPTRNQLRWDHTRASFAKPEYLPLWQIVEELGLVGLGPDKEFDWMHIQAALAG